MRQPGVGAVHRGSGPEGLSLGGFGCSRRVIKVEVCFNKDTLGHFFPTELAKLMLFRNTSRNLDFLLNKKRR